MMVLIAMQTRAADGPKNPSPTTSVTTNSPATHTVLLSPVKLELAFSRWGLAVNNQDRPFAREPRFEGRSVNRGVLFKDQGPTNALAYIWDESRGRLYLDLNRNGDLTDDPAGSLTNVNGNPSYYQFFPLVVLEFSTAHGRHSCPVEINISHYRSNPISFIAGTRLAWQGEIELSGKRWAVGLLDNQINPDGSLEKSSMMTIRPIEAKAWIFRNDTGDINRSVFHGPAKLCLEGKVYRWSLAYEGRDESARIKAVLTELPVPLGELKLSGGMIEELDLEGDYAVILNFPGPTAKVPIGKYTQKRVYLKAPRSALWATAQIPTRFSVDANQPAVLNLGGPLQHRILAQRRGNNLVLNYQLTDAGGNKYALSPQDRGKPPEFAIYQGDKQLHTGKFEFG